MLLQNKQAVIYGAGGSVGSAVARAFAREGAKVFLCGRTLAPLEVVANDIRAAGGFAHITTLDALSETDVDTHLEMLNREHGRLHISFNAIGLEDSQGKPITEMSVEDFTRPLAIAMRTQFLTARAAARHMLQHGPGVILAITATPAGKAYPLVGGFGPACSAIEGFMRNLAAEMGPNGTRVLCLRSAGSPDSKVFIDAMKNQRALAKTNLDDLVQDTMLKRLPLLAEIASAAVFAVSDLASGMTGTSLNLSCGTTPD